MVDGLGSVAVRDVYAAALDALPVQICAWDQDLRVLSVNATALRWAGVAPADAASHQLSDVLRSDVAEIIGGYFRSALAGHEVRYDRVGDDPSGVRRSFAVELVPIRTRDAVTGVCSVAVDTTTPLAQVVAGLPDPDERDRLAGRFDTVVLPRLRGALRELAGTAWTVRGRDDAASLQRVVDLLDDAVSDIRDAISQMLRDDPAAVASRPVADDVLVTPRPVWLPAPSAPVGDGYWTEGGGAALFAALPPAGVWDEQLVNVAINPAGAAVLGHAGPERVVGRPYREVAGDALADCNEGSMRAALAGEPVEYDLRFRAPDGRLMSGRIHYSAFTAADGRRLLAALSLGHGRANPAAEDEPSTDRRRIAEDLHDHVIQLLYAAQLSVENVVLNPGRPGIAAALSNAVQCVVGAVVSIHSLAGALYRVQPVEAEEAVRRVVRRSAASLGFDPTLDLVGDLGRVSAAVVDDVTAVLREALSNSARHARATSVRVLLTCAGSEARLRVADDGVGLGGEPGQSSGLLNMAARAARHGGTVSVGTHPDGGTVVDWRVPV